MTNISARYHFLKESRIVDGFRVTHGPMLSIVIVAYHSRDDLERCLPSLFTQRVDLEVIVVDNSPRDGTADWLASFYPEVKVVTNPTNTGYAAGNNLGLHHVTGEWVLILNPDTELHSGALSTLLEVAKAHPDALITPKLLSPDGTVNACGLEMHYTGITTCRGLGGNPVDFQGAEAVPLAAGAALMVCTAVLRELGGFDSSYFMYLEDVDLSLRARLRGYEIICATNAHITHFYDFGLNPLKFYYLERNRLLTLFKLYEAKTLVCLVPALLVTELVIWLFAFLKGPKFVGARLRGYLSLLQQKGLWSQRCYLQTTRQVSDQTLLCGALWTLPLGQLVGNPSLARTLSRVADPIYRFMQPNIMKAEV